MELNVVLYLLIIQCWGGLPNVLPKTMHVLCVIWQVLLLHCNHHLDLLAGSILEPHV
jgi:hypothetical protein